MANKNKKGEKVQVVRCGEIFRNHLRPMRGFYGAYLFSKSANSNFENPHRLFIFEGRILRICFKKIVQKH